MNILSVQITKNPHKERKRKTVFTPEEDKIILDFVEKYGATRWERIERIIQTRTSIQCRERYKNFLSPTVVKKEWSSEEDLLLETLVSQHGKKWSKLAEYFPGRTDILIKNRFSLLMRHVKTGKRTQNQFSAETIPLKHNQINEEEQVNSADYGNDMTTTDEPFFDFSFDNHAESNDIFSIDYFF
jgi:hypothetical protein